MSNFVLIINKFIKNIEQIDKVSSSPEQITDNIQSVMKRFGISKVISSLNTLKSSGTVVSLIPNALIVLPFVGKNIMRSVSFGVLVKKF